eukprot:Gb_34681 [translate_table: standard]
MSDRPSAPPLALGLLTQVTKSNNANEIAMADVGVLEALTKYLSLGPKVVIEEAIADLLRILFSSPDCNGCYQPTYNSSRLGSRGASYSAVRALQGLLEDENIKYYDATKQTIQPLVEMLSTGSEKEQQATIGALIKLSLENPFKALTTAIT